MSTKALKRELFAAVVMLLVACIALSGSTFAWFASNNKVEAKGMEFKAQSSASLAISATGADNTWGTVMDLETTTAAFYPVTIVSLNNDSTINNAVSGSANFTSGAKDVAFYSLTEANKVNSTDSYEAITGASILGSTGWEEAFELNTKDYIKDDIYIKYVGEDTDVPVTFEYELLTSTNVAIGINEAIHIALVNTSTGAVKQFDTTAASTKAAIGDNYVYGGTLAGVVELQPEVPEHFILYAWLEGEDEDCYSSNALITTGYTLNVSFTK